MDKPHYDNSNPGLPGIFRVGPLKSSPGPGRGYYRKWDGSQWYMASYEDTLQTAVRKQTGYGYNCISTSLLYYVADLEGNLVEPRDARRIGDPLWNSQREPKQLDLFDA